MSNLLIRQVLQIRQSVIPVSSYLRLQLLKSVEFLLRAYKTKQLYLYILPINILVYTIQKRLRSHRGFSAHRRLPSDVRHSPVISTLYIDL